MTSRAASVSRRGILNPRAAERQFQVFRHDPAPDLAPFVERHWIVRWDLRGRQPFLQELLPHPVVNLAIERDRTRVYGAGVRRSQHFLEGQGQVFGTKFRPGGFYPFIRRPMSELTRRSLSLRAAFGRPAPGLSRAVLASDDDAEQVSLVEGFLRQQLPEPDPNVDRVAELCQWLLDDRGITRVEQLVDRSGLNARRLQRLFERYVGVSPKFVLRRYRLHEAAERLAGGEVVEWAGLAVELGYFDQAHFIKDFTALVGQSPARYAAICAARAVGRPAPARSRPAARQPAR